MRLLLQVLLGFFATSLLAAEPPTLVVVTEPSWCRYCQLLDQKLTEYRQDFAGVKIGTISGLGFKNRGRLSDWRSSSSPQALLPLKLAEIADLPTVKFFPTSFLVQNGRGGFSENHGGRLPSAHASDLEMQVRDQC